MELDQSGNIKPDKGGKTKNALNETEPTTPSSEKGSPQSDLTLEKKKDQTKLIPNGVTGGSQSREVIPTPQLILQLALLSAMHIIIFC